jgi:hypothetical protein
MPENPSIPYKPNTWFLVCATVLLISVARGIRMPGDWAYTHFLFNYEAGFIKRGLVGEIFHTLNPTYSNNFLWFNAVSMVLFGCVVASLLYCLYSLVNRKSLLLTAAALLFASSLSPVYLAHTIGYFDVIGVFAVILLTQLMGMRYSQWLVLPITIICLLIHESFFIIFFPLLLVHVVFFQKKYTQKEMFLLGGGYTAISFSIAFLLANYALLNASSRGVLQDHLIKIAAIPLRYDGFSVLVRHISDNYGIMEPSLFSLWANIESLPVTLPTAIVLNMVIWKIVRPHHSAAATLVICLASFSPLAMHILAWDNHRWNALMVMTSFLNLCNVARCYPAPQTQPPYPVIALLVFLNGASTIGLFESYEVKQFPFFDEIYKILPGYESQQNHCN